MKPLVAKVVVVKGPIDNKDTRKVVYPTSVGQCLEGLEEVLTEASKAQHQTVITITVDPSQ